ncbi:MAG: hypothetical protein A2000_00970 [Ignavibacteria bacterium GWB2_36_8]|nr:MAG: hypothetical protein A2000_00970 [Ignavibacteria bacterium GWB2_36_8]
MHNMEIARYPLISVCIPTYNRQDLLKRALNSVIIQQYWNMEIIISDNCSPQKIWEEIRQLDTLDSRITVRRNLENLGWTGNLNECLKIAKGEYIIFLCDDDEFLPGLIEKEAEILCKNNNVGLIHTDGYYCDFNGNIIRSQSTSKPILKAGEEAIEKIFFKMDVFFSSAMVRKKCYDELSEFTNTCSADWEMWARIAQYYDVAYIQEPLVKFHQHNISMMPAIKFESDTLFLMEKILSYLPIEKRELMKQTLLKNLGAVFFAFVQKAWQEGKWKHGSSFLLIARKYSGIVLWIKKLLTLIIYSVPRRIKYSRLTKIKRNETFVS